MVTAIAPVGTTVDNVLGSGSEDGTAASSAAVAPVDVRDEAIRQWTGSGDHDLIDEAGGIGLSRPDRDDGNETSVQTADEALQSFFTKVARV